MPWTLKHGAEERLFAQQSPGDPSTTYWSIRDATLKRVSQAADEFSFTLDGRTVDAASLFAYNASITVYKDRVATRQSDGSYTFSGGTQWFVGRRILEPRAASGRHERNSYLFVGPWADLDEYIYQQNWKVNAAPPGGALVAQPRSHVFLNLDDNGASITSAAQIADAVNYANAAAAANGQSAPLQLAAGTPAFNLHYDEQREITCAEVIRKMLRWIPDAVTWFDYATSPPTLHIARRANVPSVTLDLSSGNKIGGLDLVRRDDLTRPAVVLKFEQINEIDGVSWTQITEQKSPAGATGTARGTLVVTIQLAGYTLNTLAATIVTKPIQAAHATDATRLAWWKARLPILNNARVLNLSIPVSSVLVPNIPTRPYELTAGQMPPWISTVVDEETITARATYQVKDPNNNVVKEVVDEEISVRITSTAVNTNSNPVTYYAIASFVSGESVPSGLADALYGALSVAQYDGQLTLVQNEIGGSVLVGNVLNITGGLAEWATMNALVQQTTEHIDEGRTTITFGPAGHLGADDLVELLRVNRFRWNYTNPAARTQGQTSGAKVELGKQTPKENSTEGAEAMKRLIVLDGNGATLVQLDIDATTKKINITGPSGYGSVKIELTNTGTLGTGGKSLEIRELDYCEAGVQKKIRVLASAPY